MGFIELVIGAFVEGDMNYNPRDSKRYIKGVAQL